MNWTIRCIENLALQVCNVVFKVRAQVIENASFGLLLGHPFQQAALCRFNDPPTSEADIFVDKFN